MCERKYGILLTIPSEQDLGSELMTENGKIVRLSSVSEAIISAEEHSRKQLFIKDWIYDIVPLDSNSRCDRPVKSYHSVPKFERIAV